MKHVIKEGKTIDIAVASAIEELGITKETANISILEEPSSGFLGLFGRKLAKVNVSELFNEVDTMKEIVTDFFNILNMSIALDITKSNKNTLNISIDHDNIGYLIGKHGATLKSLETIFSLAINKRSPYRLSVVLNIGNYLEKRKESLESYAKKMATKVKVSKRKYQFEAMSSYERKIIHSILQGLPNLKTYSIGASPNRKVVVEYKK